MFHSKRQIIILALILFTIHDDVFGEPLRNYIISMLY